MGAGPGDPELLTLRAARRLGEADLVLYDALTSDRVRALGPQAHWFYVGKRAGRHGLDQRAIERLMIRQSRRGKRVVRLKAGDPFVFGRGGEEALALHAAGVPFEVIPGLTSCITAPAAAGIPVTHRGTASAFAVITGHAAAAYGPVIDSITPEGLTLIVLMGLGNRAVIAERLRASGWRASTPAAVVLAASTPEQWRWMGTLEGLGVLEIPAAQHGLPGVLVVGQVVSLAATIAAGGSLTPENTTTEDPEVRHERAW
jgi:uroporphyrin-III C-methyltransferase/precorrin-2 dehydrogenase/sirohydrochlorin ferrochelatase